MRRRGRRYGLIGLCLVTLSVSTVLASLPDSAFAAQKPAQQKTAKPTPKPVAAAKPAPKAARLPAPVAAAQARPSSKTQSAKAQSAKDRPAKAKAAVLEKVRGKAGRGTIAAKAQEKAAPRLSAGRLTVPKEREAQAAQPEIEVAVGKLVAPKGAAPVLAAVARPAGTGAEAPGIIEASYSPVRDDDAEAEATASLNRASAGLSAKLAAQVVTSAAAPSQALPVTTASLSPPPRPAPPQPDMAAAARVPASIPDQPLAALAQADVDRYRQLFAATRAGDTATADALIAQIDNKMLVGHALRLRYLDAAHHHTTTEEARRWLASYGDLAGAEDIRTLAGSGIAPITSAGRIDRNKAGATSTQLLDSPLDMLPSEEFGRSARSPGARSVAPAIAAALRSDRPDDAVRMLDEPSIGGALDTVSQDIAKADIANYFYMAGDDKTAYQLASEVAERSGEAVPQADWTAGLAAWRMKQPDKALKHFEAVAQSPELSVWMVSAGAFWAARADISADHPEKVIAHLNIAAAYPQTFYGLMASRLLGRDIAATPDLTSIDNETLARAVQMPAVKRAAALARIGEADLASAELGLVRADLAPTQTAAIDALAVRFGLVNAAEMGSGRYPVPALRPSDGLKVDRALLFAFAKQESGFNSRAVSPAGAVGLMQIMPGTARLVSNWTGLPYDRRSPLSDPTVNLSLGQGYLSHLMEDGLIGNNLLYVAAAYNAGPGNVDRWIDEVRYNDDPLLFIESIPIAETRLYIERVLANFWIYQARLGQNLQSLDAAASGAWPVYKPQDAEVLRNVSQSYARN